MKAKQPVPLALDSDGTVDPMLTLIQAVKKGAVLDGEVVMHRKLRRPVFIVFDVLCISTDQPILHLSFEQRLTHLMKASFCIENLARDIFSESEVVNPTTALPLVRKNFVKRTQLDRLFDRIFEEKGSRYYRDGNTHNHQTDGIIFQPNTPYVSSTDNRLLKWKYLDTVTIDVQLLGQFYQDNVCKLRVGVLGDEGTIIDMTRFINLPFSDILRLEADRNEGHGSNIIEVGFDPTVGDWYYRTMRGDKTTPNHISTVLGTLLEVSEGLGTEELRYRLSIPSNCRDTYRRDFKRMQKQLLDHLRDQFKHSQQSGRH
jgi:mRNA-capping enzyme